MAENTKKRYCVDASYMLAFLLPDERESEVARIFEEYALHKNELVTTTLLKYEVSNALWSAVKRKRLSSRDARKLLKAFGELEIAEHDVSVEELFESARSHKLSCYDASYFVLSKKTHSQLLSLDAKLLKAFR
jgi:predicted nucleic acid-binding protein